MRTVFKVFGLSTFVTLWLTGSFSLLLLPAPQESIVPHIAIARSKFKVWFLLSVNHFHKIVKLKNH